MNTMVWIGAGLAILGVLGLMVCVVHALRLRQHPPERREQMQDGLQKLIVWNATAMGLGCFGVAMVIVGLVLG